jgi:hypothetical protein
MEWYILSLTNFSKSGRVRIQAAGKNNIFVPFWKQSLCLDIKALFFYRVGTGCAMDFPALFSFVHLLTARWQRCFAPKLKKEVESGVTFWSREHLTLRSCFSILTFAQHLNCYFIWHLMSYFLNVNCCYLVILLKLSLMMCLKRVKFDETVRKLVINDVQKVLTVVKKNRGPYPIIFVLFGKFNFVSTIGGMKIAFWRGVVDGWIPSPPRRSRWCCTDGILMRSRSARKKWWNLEKNDHKGRV